MKDISERCTRPCNTCVWTDDMYLCKMDVLDYEMEGERTSREYSANYPLSHPIIQALPCRFHLTSDEFFANNEKKFDLIFIDGLHEAHQVF